MGRHAAPGLRPQPQPSTPVKEETVKEETGGLRAALVVALTVLLVPSQAVRSQHSSLERGRHLGHA